MPKDFGVTWDISVTHTNTPREAAKAAYEAMQAGNLVFTVSDDQGNQTQVDLTNDDEEEE